jgi:predicted amino acid-binding ACT domain protein
LLHDHEIERAAWDSRLAAEIARIEESYAARLLQLNTTIETQQAKISELELRLRTEGEALRAQILMMRQDHLQALWQAELAQ